MWHWWSSFHLDKEAVVICWWSGVLLWCFYVNISPSKQSWATLKQPYGPKSTSTPAKLTMEWWSTLSVYNDTLMFRHLTSSNISGMWQKHHQLAYKQHDLTTIRQSTITIIIALIAFITTPITTPIILLINHIRTSVLWLLARLVVCCLLPPG